MTLIYKIRALNRIFAKRFEPIQLYKYFHFLLCFHGLSSYQIISKNNIHYIKNSLTAIVAEIVIFTATIIAFVISLQGTLEGVMGSFVSKLTLLLHIVNILLNIAAYIWIFIMTNFWRYNFLQDICDLNKINVNFYKIIGKSKVNQMPSGVLFLSITITLFIGLITLVFDFLYIPQHFGNTGYFLTLIYGMPFVIFNILVKEIEVFLYIIKYEFKLINEHLNLLNLHNQKSTFRKTFINSENQVSSILFLYSKLCDKLEEVNEHFGVNLLIIFVNGLFTICQGTLVLILIACDIFIDNNQNFMFKHVGSSYLFIVLYRFFDIIFFIRNCEECVKKVIYFIGVKKVQRLWNGMFDK